MILSQADANKEGKLSSDECMSIYTDKYMAEKNCTFWDVNKDGIITEDEYVMQALNIGKKNSPFAARARSAFTATQYPLRIWARICLTAS